MADLAATVIGRRPGGSILRSRFVLGQQEGLLAARGGVAWTREHLLLASLRLARGWRVAFRSFAADDDKGQKDSKN